MNQPAPAINSQGPVIDPVLPPLRTRFVLPYLSGLRVKMVKPVASEVRLQAASGRVWDMTAAEFHRHHADGSIQRENNNLRDKGILSSTFDTPRLEAKLCLEPGMAPTLKRWLRSLGLLLVLCVCFGCSPPKVYMPVHALSNVRVHEKTNDVREFPGSGSVPYQWIARRPDGSIWYVETHRGIFDEHCNEVNEAASWPIFSPR